MFELFIIMRMLSNENLSKIMLFVHYWLLRYRVQLCTVIITRRITCIFTESKRMVFWRCDRHIFTLNNCKFLSIYEHINKDKGHSLFFLFSTRIENLFNSNHVIRVIKHSFINYLKYIFFFNVQLNEILMKDKKSLN